MNSPQADADRLHAEAVAGTLVLPTSLRRQIESAATAGYPHEACGVLLGRAEAGNPARLQVEGVAPARNLNVARARDRYELDPQALLSADRQARADGLDVVGVWHSHPDHPPVPSAIDREHAWESWAYVIVSVVAGQVDVLRAWRLIDGAFTEQEVTS